MAETQSAHGSGSVSGAKQDVVVSARPTAKTGTISVTYNPGPGDPKETEVFGEKVKAGESVDIPSHHADKIRGNPYFSLKGEKTYGDDSLPGSVQEDREEASFEENVARERGEEYLNSRPLFANSAPGEAERVARAQQAAADLRAAQEDGDADKPRRGRPPKAH